MKLTAIPPLKINKGGVPMLYNILTVTPAPSWVDVSWISSIAEGITSVFSVMTQPPVNIFIGVGLLGTVVGLIKKFMPHGR